MPYGLENSNTFLEKSIASTAFGTSSGLGVSLDAWTDNVGMRIAATQQEKNSFNTSLRLSFAPINTENLVFHLGFSGQYNGLNADNTNVNYSSVLETKGRGGKTVSSGDIPALSIMLLDSMLLYLEVLFSYKRNIIVLM